ncbi:hypothetical protein FH972_012230 [Carpinus fangiana]|uniref:TF-B3 domain-containing protein n=1 Tax=Carpinus fangiana TaxID=176857 RepID=A0A5N6R362_9ROSI|nr:hypothetical protein FH972_012230 [Carpinus fangiana]
MEFSLLSSQPSSHALPSGRSLSGDQLNMETLNLVLGFGATTNPSGEKPQGSEGVKSKVSKNTKTENDHQLLNVGEATGLALPERSILSGHPSSHALPSGRSLSGDQLGMETLDLNSELGFGATTKSSGEKPQGSEGEKSKVSKDTKTENDHQLLNVGEAAGLETQSGHALGDISLELELGRTTCITRKREATESTANVLPPSFKRMKHGCPNDASLDLKLYLDPWDIKKTIETSDTDGLSRLLLPKTPVREHILRLWDAKRIADGIPVRVWDIDTNSEHELIFKYWPSGSGTYVLQRNWTKEFVTRRTLEKGDEIGLSWDESYSRFNFCVLKRA